MTADPADEDLDAETGDRSGLRGRKLVVTRFAGRGTSRKKVPAWLAMRARPADGHPLNGNRGIKLRFIARIEPSGRAQTSAEYTPRTRIPPNTCQKRKSRGDRSAVGFAMALVLFLRQSRSPYTYLSIESDPQWERTFDPAIFRSCSTGSHGSYSRKPGLPTSNEQHNRLFQSDPISVDHSNRPCVDCQIDQTHVRCCLGGIVDRFHRVGDFYAARCESR